MADIRTVPLEDMDGITINGVEFVRRGVITAADAFSFVKSCTKYRLALEGVIIAGKNDMEPGASRDPHVEANVAALRERSAAGLKKYGTDLTRGDLSTSRWLQHMIEELLDGANYARVLLSRQGLRRVDPPADAEFGELGEFYVREAELSEPARKLVGWRYRHRKGGAQGVETGWTWISKEGFDGRENIPPKPHANLILEELYA